MPRTRNASGVNPIDARLPGLTSLTYFAAAFFALTLVTDLAYVQTLVLMWRDFSSWLLFFGLVMGGLATLVWLFSLAWHRHHPAWSVVFLNALVLAVAFVNSLVHAGDGWVAIMPWGVGLSILTSVLMLTSAALRHSAIAAYFPRRV